MKRKILNRLYPQLDRLYRSVDRDHVYRTKNIRLIPDIRNRKGGKRSYAEWAHVIGIFQTLMYQNLARKTGNKILDIGCGTGLLGISAEPFTQEGGSYTGLDVMQYDIAFCKKHYTQENYKFIHFDIANPTYAKSQTQDLKPWPLQDNDYDLVVALSVWTHLNEQDARYYLQEVQRVLKPGGKAIITFFSLDEEYQQSLSKRSHEKGRYHQTLQDRWVFDKKAYDSGHWFTPKWAKNPEDAIAIDNEALKLLLDDSKLELEQVFPGNWKEIPGVFFQDVLVFKK